MNRFKNWRDSMLIKGAVLLLLLIAGHVLMVGVHEGMWRDGTLARMAGRRGTGF